MGNAQGIGVRGRGFCPLCRLEGWGAGSASESPSFQSTPAHARRLHNRPSRSWQRPQAWLPADRRFSSCFSPAAGRIGAGCGAPAHLLLPVAVVEPGWCHGLGMAAVPPTHGSAPAWPRGAASQRLWILRVLHTSPCLAQGKTPLVLPDFIGTLPPSLPGGGPGRSAAPAPSFLPEAVPLGLNLPGNTLIFCKPGLGRSGIWEKLEQGAGKLRAAASQHWMASERIAGHRGTTKGH